MSQNNKWKNRLLSSSIPLEYEVASIITKEGFIVDFDYAYQRCDEKEEKEFSIDLLAKKFSVFKQYEISAIQVDLIVECKYRNPDVHWVFMPNSELDSELIHFCSALKIFPHFSEFRLKSNKEMHQLNNCNGLPISQISKKGIEINTTSGEVHDTGIHHGINQLMYSLPIVLSEIINESFENDLSVVCPYAYCPILVTTADLRMLKNNFSNKLVKNAEALEEISDAIPYLMFSTGLYPTFKTHCKNVFRNIPAENGLERFNYYNDLHAISIKNSDKNIFPTEKFMNGLKKGFEQGCFTDFIICNLNYLDDLLLLLKNSINHIIIDTEKLTKKL
ncbi:hypothetical protein ACUNWD_05005 [Sunxiuqinia sp. A32]|uniref:hypothetical protein n=1 Tax=Sunxiuqinia sp. A32 TaxID=3461496 RepID=UPI0040464E34